MKTLALAVTAALIGLPGAAQAAAPTVTHERGIVLECTGTIKQRPVYASLYENSAYQNVLQILIGKDGHQIGGGREPKAKFLNGKRVTATMKVGGDRARVAGTAARYGKRIAVHESFDDAGEHIVVDGFHRKLRNDLTFTWRGRTVPLDCDTAFAYDLQVSRESTVED